MTTNVTHLMVDLGAVLAGGHGGEIAKAKSRALHTVSVMVGFASGSRLGAADEAAAGLWSLILPSVLALFAFAIGLEAVPTARRIGDD
jgi:uncharacterized membrane protein YoaK (UPF0700 family)